MLYFIDKSDIPVDSRQLKYSYGSWVIYCRGGRDLDTLNSPRDAWEIGRVVEDMGAAVRVITNNSCRAVLIQKDFLRPADVSEIEFFGTAELGNNMFNYNCKCPYREFKCDPYCWHCLI